MFSENKGILSHRIQGMQFRDNVYPNYLSTSTNSKFVTVLDS